VSPTEDERNPLKAKFDTILQRRKAELDIRKRRMFIAFLCCLFLVLGFVLVTRLVWPSAVHR